MKLLFVVIFADVLVFPGGPSERHSERVEAGLSNGPRAGASDAIRLSERRQRNSAVGPNTAHPTAVGKGRLWGKSGRSPMRTSMARLRRKQSSAVPGQTTMEPWSRSL
jgi:hypothetical protein